MSYVMEQILNKVADLSVGEKLELIRELAEYTHIDYLNEED